MVFLGDWCFLTFPQCKQSQVCGNTIQIFQIFWFCILWKVFFNLTPLHKLSPFIGQVENAPAPIQEAFSDSSLGASRAVVFPALYTLHCQLCSLVPLVCMWLYEDKPSVASIWAPSGCWMSLLVTEWLRHWPHLCPWLPFNLPSTVSTYPRLLNFIHCLQDGSWTWSVS